MRDEDFEYFLSKFGEVIKCILVLVKSLKKWCNKFFD